MKKTYKDIQKNKFDSRFGIGFGISLVCIFILLTMLLGTINKPISERYFINFYDGDELITTEKVEVGTTIDKNRLDEIAISYLGEDTEYKYEWSLRSDKYMKVNFDHLNKDTNVYLYKYYDEFSVTVDSNELFSYTVNSDGPIISGSSVVVEINKSFDPKQYHMNVYANNQLIEENDDGNYLIENINEDIVINVKLLEIYYIKPIISDVYVYDGNIKDIGYIVHDYEGNEVDISDILIRYYDQSGSMIDNIIDAGRYKVEYIYLGNKYHIETESISVDVGKQMPTINVYDKYVYYDGSPQGFNILDVETNSDGLIEFINNDNIDVGTYEVQIIVHESKNYLSISTKAYLNILINKPNISENPIADVGFEGHTLNDVQIEGGITDTEGIFKWKDPDTVLDVGTHEYVAVFIPDDVGFEPVELVLIVETISYEEQLRRIKSDRELLLESEQLFDGDSLITKSPGDGSDIIWMSLSSALMVDSGGNINIIGSPGTYTVDIIGIMMYGDAAEYVTITLNIVIDTGGGIQVARL